MNALRIVMTLFVAALLTIITLAWIWTGNNQPPDKSTASHAVLAIAAVAGLWALVTIWRHNPRRLHG